MSLEKIIIEPMRSEDMEDVMVIENLAFPTAWPANAFLSEIKQNQLAYYVVARFGETKESRKVVGYAGVWLVIDEVHITTIAVHPEERGKKIGEQLLLYLLNYAINRNIRWATLEVRESNKSAQSLYKKYGFSQVGVRKNYYAEEGENAVVMWAGNLQGELFKERLEYLGKAMINKSLNDIVC